MSLGNKYDFQDFLAWIRNSERGDNVIYFKGKSLESPQTIKGENGNIEIVWVKADIGLAAWIAYEKGLITLTQRKKSKKAFGDFEYIATRL